MRYARFLFLMLFLFIISWIGLERFAGKIVRGDNAANSQNDKNGETGQYKSDFILKRAIDQCEKNRIVDARIRLKVTLFGNSYSGNGFYLEKRNEEQAFSDYSKRLFLLEMTFHPSSISSGGEEPNTLKVVYPGGKEFMKYSSIEGEKQLQRIDLERLAEAIYRTKAPIPLSNLVSMPAFGGLKGTLVQLSHHYTFDGNAQHDQLGSQAFGVWKIRATMKNDVLEKTLKSIGGEKASLEKVGAQIPTGVLLYFGMDDFFPYRIDYFNGPVDKIDWTAPYIQQDFLEVAINSGDISNSRFQFIPPKDNIILEDGTEEYMKLLGL